MSEGGGHSDGMEEALFAVGHLVRNDCHVC